MLVLGCAGWLWDQLSALPADMNPLYIQAGVAVSIVLGFGILLLWLFNKPSIVDFMIATEAEMRKVNWPTRKEIVGSTWVVIFGTLFITAILLLNVVLSVWWIGPLGLAGVIPWSRASVAIARGCASAFASVSYGTSS